MYTCTIYIPQNHIRLHSHRLVHENPTTRTRTHTLTSHTTQHSLTAQSLIHSLSPIYNLLLQRRKEKKYFSSTNFLCESPSGLRTQCAFSFFFFVHSLATSLSVGKKDVHRMNDAGTRTLREVCVPHTTPCLSTLYTACYEACM